MFKPVSAKVSFPKIEEKILRFWKKNKIFEKTIRRRPKTKELVFYDGPPFATGLPHYGHIVPGTVKDIIPRYWTMKGYRVERRFGWDCHGLPVEYELERELKIKDKKEILKMGIAKFNEACRGIVLRYTKEWERVIPRLGRWVDFKNDYRTMDPAYMESIWWVVKSLWDKGLIYEGYKSLHICPRCATPISNFEVAQGYEDKKDKSVVIKFELLDRPGTFLLAWTTTPWTLPGNVLLAVGPKIKYIEVSGEKEKYILAKEKVKEVFGQQKFKVSKKISSKELVGKKYKPLFNIAPRGKKSYVVVAADFVSTEEGTGIVHVAPAFGEEDLLTGQKEKAAFVQHIDMDGKVTKMLPKFKGISVFELNDRVIEDLSRRELLFSSFDIVHSYPHCWRCETPLLNYAMKTWFVAVTRIKDKLIANNRKIKWVPSHVKYGRFGKWLEGARDWAISRNRYWGTPLPIWRCDKTEEIEVIGSIKELEKKAGRKVSDLHLHKIKNLTWLNSKTGGTMRLSGEVLDCWFESGSMPYAFSHYPFENKKWFEEHFPADFIAESIDQTRGWFYTLHVLATALFNKPAFKNVVTNGMVLAEDGQKMSKRRKNYPDPEKLVREYGADALRFYLMSSAVIKGEDLCFSEKGVVNVLRRVFLTLWNVYRFFVINANVDQWKTQVEIKSKPKKLDLWILTRLNETVLNVTESLEHYDISQALGNIPPFIEDLSTWYVRRSRDRVGPTAVDKEDKDLTYTTLRTVLVVLAKILAPFTPFLAEEIHKNLTDDDSVHLTDWPEVRTRKVLDQELLKQMVLVRKICELGHAARKEAKIKVRQPLKSAKCKVQSAKLDVELLQLIKDELNVKEIIWQKKKIKEPRVELDTEITPQLRVEGEDRELIRQIQQLRKERKCRLDETIDVITPRLPHNQGFVSHATIARDFKKGEKLAIKK
ncbi:isoleucine--tRNA ligase [Patescibacteria group bacterium]|nr:isoleucine--tRNA ligase [Patescibacteria group bacterium]